MVPGPVFTFELLTTARRGRFYWARAGYATVLLLILWSVQTAWLAAYSGEIPVSVMRWFGISAFAAIAVGQEILVLLFTPALVAGVIADEKRRKTLHYLLASRLSGPEIVLGKLMVRMLYVGVLLGVSFPVMSLLVLFGGLDPMLVLMGCAGLASTAWFLAALSVWVSTLARRPREALLVTFGLEALWLVVPPLVEKNFSMGWLAGDPATALLEWIGASSPVFAARDLAYSLVVPMPTVVWERSFCWMIGLQAAAGVVLATLAAIQLRPVFKRQEGTLTSPRGLRAMLSRRRRRALPSIGERPMLWKEFSTGGARGFARFVGGVLTLIFLVLLLYHGVWRALWAFTELRESGYPRAGIPVVMTERTDFYHFLRWSIPLIYTFSIVAVAGSAAASITSELEDDTWLSLTATDLTGPEIVRAKLFGALWRARRPAELLVLFLVAGIAAGSLHCLTLPVVALALAIYGWFAAALGIRISVQLRSTWRSQFLTIAMLLLVNVAGQGILNLFWVRGFVPQIWPGFTPYEVAKLVTEPGIIHTLKTASPPRLSGASLTSDSDAWLAIFGVVSLVLYGVLALFLTSDTIRRFEVAAGRARRLVGQGTAADRQEPAVKARPDPLPLSQIR